MELWIRSQDRQDLIKVGELFATTNLLNNDDWEIVTIANENNTCHLGKYKTKERALEILDKIQQLIVEYSQSLDYKIVPIYEMPKE